MREDRVSAGIGRERCDASIRSGRCLSDDWTSGRKTLVTEMPKASRGNDSEQGRPGSKGIGLPEQSTSELCLERRIDFSLPCSSRNDAFHSSCSMQAGPRRRSGRKPAEGRTAAA